MAIDILYFAWIREAIGKDGERFEEDAGTVAELIDRLEMRGAGYATAFADRARVRAAVDQRFAGLDGSLAGAREVALFPPVTGGR